MGNLVQKIEWSIGSINGDLENSYLMYIYGEASMRANEAMQEPLEKLYRYEHQIDMRLKVKEYIGELDEEIDRCTKLASESSNDKDIARYITRAITLQDVKTDLLSRLEETVY